MADVIYSQPMLLYLVRHGLTSITGKKLTGWMPGISLSDEGIAQARAAAERLADVDLSAVYSSPLERCVETAREVAVPRKMKVRTLPGVGEVRYGDWQGKTFVTLYKSRAWKELKARPADFRFPNGETIREAQTRGMTTIEGLRGKHRGEAVLVCSHADLIRVVVAGYLGLPLDLYDRITIAPASTTVLLLGDVPRLIKLGETGDHTAEIKRLKASGAKR